MDTLKPQAQKLQELQLVYEFKNAEAIEDYLDKHPAFFEVLNEIQARLRTYFPQGPLLLEFVPDADGDEDLKLIIWFYPAADVPEILGKFNQFKIDWWSDKHDEIDWAINIYVEHPKLSSGDPWKSIESLIGTLEGPGDLAAEHDHYLYGTAKRYQG